MFRLAKGVGIAVSRLGGVRVLFLMLYSAFIDTRLIA